MLTLVSILKGFLIGMAIAIPIGPIGILCIKKTLELGIEGALLVGLGTTLADVIYGMIAITGFSAISNTLLSQTRIIKLLGGLFLLYLAYVEIKNNPTNNELKSENRAIKLIRDVFILTIINPISILTFIGVFASISYNPTSSIQSIIMILGIFLGSMSWWYTLGTIVVKIKHKLPDIWLNRMKIISSIMIAGFGAFTIINAVISSC